MADGTTQFGRFWLVDRWRSPRGHRLMICFRQTGQTAGPSVVLWVQLAWKYSFFYMLRNDFVVLLTSEFTLVGVYWFHVSPVLDGDGGKEKASHLSRHLFLIGHHLVFIKVQGLDLPGGFKSQWPSCCSLLDMGQWNFFCSLCCLLVFFFLCVFLWRESSTWYRGGPRSTA